MALAQDVVHQKMLEKAQRYFPGGSNGNVTLPPEDAFIIASGQGSHVYDLEGHVWIDYLLVRLSQNCRLFMFNGAKRLCCFQ